MTRIPKRLHLACGSVYLRGYINIDIDVNGNSFSAALRPDLVKENITDFAHYYKEDVRRAQFLSGAKHDKPIVVDEFADIRVLPYLDGMVDEILAVQVFEHFTFAEGDDVLKEWHRVLKRGGVLHIDIPDLEDTIQLYLKDPIWATRLLYGSQKNEYSIHKSMYTVNTIKEKLEKAGFGNFKMMPNMHTYPAFGIKAIKL